MKILCSCGCRNELENTDKRGRKRRYLIGHHNKGKNNFWKIKDKVKIRTIRERAVKICQLKTCLINNEQCKGNLQIHHIDNNPYNNNYYNLTCLCASHHQLLHNRNLNLNELNQHFKYYTDSSGKRRYIK